MPVTTRHLTVGPSDGGVRLDSFLVRQIPELTRSRIKSLIEAGHVTVDGRTIKPSAKTAVGQVVQITLPEVQPAAMRPQAMTLDILFEDRDMVVVNKPPGLVVHPAAGNPDRTLVNALLHHCTDLSGIGGVLRPGIVHRLDKGTSGVIVAAKNDAAHNNLAEQFSNRTVGKQYRGIVLGKPMPANGTWNQPIGRHPSQRKKMSVRSKSPRTALTRYQCLGHVDQVSALALHIETGRTHQIRVHCAAAGYPVAHDELYGGIKRIRSIPNETLRDLLDALTRPALHAHRLELSHPTSQKPCVFQAPLPKDMATIFDFLGVEYA